MRRSPLLFLFLFLLLLLCPAASAQDIVKRVGSVTFVVDDALGFPGGLFVVRLQSRYGLGTAWAILDGRRSPFTSGPRGPRAFVPVPVGTVPGKNVIGVEIAARRGRQRVPVTVTVAEHAYPPRQVVVPEPRRALLEGPGTGHGGRVLLGFLRTQTPKMRPAWPLRSPVASVGTGFGSAQTYEGASGLEGLVDSVWGEVHRGLDFEVPPGSEVLSPGAGTILFAGPLLLTGQTVVIDHGQGIVSALFHMSRLDVAASQTVEGRSRIGLSGDTGVCPAPMVQWRVYVNGTAVDPRLLDRSIE